MDMTHAENIMAVYGRATVSEIREGLSWYSDAHAIALHLANGDVWRGAGVIAALSPRVRWERNVMLAREAFGKGYATGHTKAQTRQANRILRGEHTLEVIKGDKTRAFAETIATNGVTDVVTIDRHAHDIAVATVYTDKTRPVIGKVLYRELSTAYTVAARELGFSVAQVQAITWVRWRNEK